jgi:hypothetical protein
VGKNDITWGQANSTGVPPNKKVNKAEELTNLSPHIVCNIHAMLVIIFITPKAAAKLELLFNKLSQLTLANKALDFLPITLKTC